jgi:hypothetical protein
LQALKTFVEDTTRAQQDDRRDALADEIRQLRQEVQQLRREAQSEPSFHTSFQRRFSAWLQDQYAQGHLTGSGPDDVWRSLGQPGGVVTALLRIGPDGQCALDVFHGGNLHATCALMTPEKLQQRALPDVLAEARQFLGLDQATGPGPGDAEVV